MHSTSDERSKSRVLCIILHHVRVLVIHLAQFKSITIIRSHPHGKHHHSHDHEDDDVLSYTIRMGLYNKIFLLWLYLKVIVI